jgi:hypothetical protein
MQSLEELKDGDTKYGCYLACIFSGKADHSIRHAQCLTDFSHQYSMMSKRLPVIEVSFDNDDNYYVETATSSLSAVTKPSDKAERFSFSNLHMHHYWEMWLGKGQGKTAKNILLTGSTAGLLMLALTGILLYIRRQLKKRRLPANAGV